MPACTSQTRIDQRAKPSHAFLVCRMGAWGVRVPAAADQGAIAPPALATWTLWGHRKPWALWHGTATNTPPCCCFKGSKSISLQMKPLDQDLKLLTLVTSTSAQGLLLAQYLAVTLRGTKGPCSIGGPNLGLPHANHSSSPLCLPAAPGGLMSCFSQLRLDTRHELL